MTVRRRPIRYRLPPFRVEAAFTTLSETVDWGLQSLHVPDHWRETRGRDVRVALLDTGLETSHPDLQEAVDAVRDLTGGRTGAADLVGHGTHVAGIVGARQNGRGVVGVAPECRLLIGKVLGDDGSGSDAAVAAGIDWAVAAGADVISMSLGSVTFSDTIAQAVARAAAAGKFLVCAAGNDGRDDSVNYPARLDGTIAVGAVDRAGRLCDFSSRGDQVDVCAPGQDVLSTFLNGGYAKLSGTSMATPFVAGVVALVLAKHRAAGGATPVDTPAQLIEHLQRSAIDAGPQGRDPSYGYGLVNPDGLLTDAPPSGVPVPSPAPIATRFELGPLQVNGVGGVLVFVPSTK
jgi:subtilisin family serine protease